MSPEILLLLATSLDVVLDTQDSYSVLFKAGDIGDTLWM